MSLISLANHTQLPQNYYQFAIIYLFIPSHFRESSFNMTRRGMKILKLEA